MLSTGIPQTPDLPFVGRLSGFGANTALVADDHILTYSELADRVAQAARRLEPQRRLTVVAMSNTVDSVVGYLGALAAGHAVILTSPENEAAISARYGELAHDLHPELALLLSTSGSTGAAKLVRLSYENLQANAAAIASYLDLAESDRAATTLPLHYCYGLSVLHSHLLSGASVVVTDRSVTDPAFWELARRHEITSFAGVPHTFELLDRIGFEAPSSLRYLTQAGGRLAPDRVKHWAEKSASGGWRFFVMYGQTEATARMAYLPPDLAAAHPGAIGIPIPGGSFRLEPDPGWPGEDTGELVYTGPNVILGYADGPDDLARGRDVHELRTGDIGRRTASGLFEIVGRRSRFLKLFGLRIDLQQIETVLAEHGIAAVCTGNDEYLVLALTGKGAAERARRIVGELAGLPPAAIRVLNLDVVPRLGNGKPDYQALIRMARGHDDAASTDLIKLFESVLGPGGVSEDSSFTGLGGDSLSYVEMSIKLERLLGTLPPRWETMPIRDLRLGRDSARSRAKAKPRPRLDTSIALRAVAILLILGNHAPLFSLQGGAFVLLGVAGFNFARFQLTGDDRWDRLRRIGRSVLRIVIPTSLWIALAHFTVGDYSWTNIFFLTFFTGGDRGNSEWVFWFVEALVWILLAMGVLLATRLGADMLRRFPFGLPFGLMLAGLPARYDLIPGLTRHDFIATPLVVFWLFALGWAVASAESVRHRILVSAAIVAFAPGFLGLPLGGLIIVAGLLLLTWCAYLPSTRAVNVVCGALAGASLYIYITHWVLLSRIERGVLLLAPSAGPAVPVVKFLVCLAFGLAFTALVNWIAGQAKLKMGGKRSTTVHAHTA